MREIKFRAWDSDNNQMLNDYASNNLSSGGINISIYHSKSNAYYATNLVLMQYTGLKDKNGKEIYEGDVVDYGNNRFYKVIFKDGCFCMENLEGMSFLLKLHNVIGNIYENPELLK